MAAFFGMAFCPNCKKPVDFSVRTGLFPKSKIGAPTLYTCKHCGSEYSDGMKEWTQVSALEKALEIFRFACIDVVVTAVAGFVVWVALMILLNASAVGTYLAFIAAAVVLALCVFFNIRNVRLSKKRAAEE